MNKNQQHSLFMDIFLRREIEIFVPFSCSFVCFWIRKTNFVPQNTAVREFITKVSAL